MNRIHEEFKFQTLIVPVSMGNGATVTGAYVPLAGVGHDALFEVNFGALPEGKKVTVEVYEADSDAGANAQELAAAETVFTAGVGGVTDGKILISVPSDQFSKEYVTVKVTNDKATALLGHAELILTSTQHHANLNEDASAVTVI